MYSHLGFFSRLHHIFRSRSWDQRAKSILFQVFKEGNTWGLRSKFPLPAGYFIGNFVGAMMPLVDVPKYLRAQSDEMIVVQCDMEGGGKQKIALVTRQYGSCTRFIGRAAKGNVVARTVMAEGWIGNLPNIALFTKETVPPFAPLVLDTSFCDTVNVGPLYPYQTIAWRKSCRSSFLFSSFCGLS